jgi:hypothetical protein
MAYYVGVDVGPSADIQSIDPLRAGIASCETRRGSVKLGAERLQALNNLGCHADPVFGEPPRPFLP